MNKLQGSRLKVQVLRLACQGDSEVLNALTPNTWGIKKTGPSLELLGGNPQIEATRVGPLSFSCGALFSSLVAAQPPLTLTFPIRRPTMRKKTGFHFCLVPRSLSTRL